MDSSISINERLFWVGSHDRITDLFESIWPLPNGISYNSYVLADEKVILFDTVKSNSVVLQHNCDNYFTIKIK